MLLFKYTFYGLLAISVLIIYSGILWLTHQHLINPLDFINQPVEKLAMVRDSLFVADYLPSGREYSPDSP